MFFEYPALLWLLAVPVLLVGHYLWMELKGRRPHLRVSASTPWKLQGRRPTAITREVTTTRSIMIG